MANGACLSMFVNEWNSVVQTHYLPDLCQLVSHCGAVLAGISKSEADQLVLRTKEWTGEMNRVIVPLLALSGQAVVSATTTLAAQRVKTIAVMYRLPSS